MSSRVVHWIVQVKVDLKYLAVKSSVSGDLRNFHFLGIRASKTVTFHPTTFSNFLVFSSI